MSCPLSSCLVTGGAGFIGSHLATRLITDGCRLVRVLDNLQTGTRENLASIADQIEFIQGDVRDPEVVANAVCGVETVFHQAALPSVPLSIEDPLTTHEVCATGTLNVLEASRRAGVRRLIYAGSSSAYGDSPEIPSRETQAPEVLSPYAAAKLSGEAYCQAFAAIGDLEVVRLRYFNVFGPRQDPNSPYSAVIPLFAAALLEGRPARIYGSGEQSRDFVFVDDVVQANLLAATVPGISGRFYNVASGTSIRIVDLLQSISELLEKPFAPEFHPPRPGDVLHSGADISRIERELGYSPGTRFREGLEKTLQFYREAGNSRGAVQG